jgi:acyl-CoA synthetase (AMP-forming)/AMP-acid ligase II
MDVIAIHAAAKGSRPAVVMDGRSLTWWEYFELRNRLANALVTLGVGRGEHVVVYALNSIETVLAGAASRAIGAIPVPMNHRLTADEAAYILDDSDAVVVLAGDAFLPILDAVRAGASRVRHWILLEQERRPWALQLDDLLAGASPEPVPDDPAQGLGGSMIYTAGTTGKPKGALRTSADPQRIIEGLKALDLAEEHVHLAAGPLYHSAPGAFATYAHLFGGAVVIMRKFDAEHALALIQQHQCTSTFMAPTLLKRIVDLPPEVRRRYDVSSMRAIIMAAAPCPMKVKEGVIEYFGPALYEFYGSTELGMNTILRPEDVLRKPNSCGTAAPGSELAILDDAGEPVAAGTPGTLYVRRSPAMLESYYKKAEATREMARGDWLTVGDVAWIDADGFVYICDRKRDMIISGGVNIYPAEIEDALHRHPAIEDVAVFGVPDDDWGERVHAAVELRPGECLTAEEVVAFARARIADYKVPREVSFHETLPRDSAGKLLKRALREPHWAGRTARI